MNEPAPRHPLKIFADKWELDGDLIRCRVCIRGQHSSLALQPFHHRAGCINEHEAPDPWKVLASLITAQISRAEYPPHPPSDAKDLHDG